MILVAPIFPSQPWFPQMLRQLCGQSYVLPKTDQILYLPGKGSKHRFTTMRLGAFRLSGKPSSVLAYQGKLQTSSCAHGDLLHKSNMGRISKKWVLFCNSKQVSTINSSLRNIITFLTELHDDGLGYSAINTVKSVLSSVFEIIHKRDIEKKILSKDL